MLPKIIVHNSISLDGSLTNFEVNMEIHYQIAGKYKPDAHFIGSNTIKSGIKLYRNVSLEEKKDFVKPKRDANLPYWVIIDSKSSLFGLLHEVRRFEFCKDVIVLISEKTSQRYINYLKERNYDYFIIGKSKVDLKKSFEFLFKKYKIKTILTDCGKILSNILINQGFVDEISLLIHPVIVGDESYNIFSNVTKKIKLKLIKNEILNKNYIWLVFKIIYV